MYMLHKISKIIIICMIALATFLFFYNKVFAVDTILKVAFDPNSPPYQFLENGESAGVHIDIMNKIAEKYNYIIEYVPIENPSKCIEAMENGEVDIVLGVINNNLTDYKVELTENMSQSSICMIVRNDKIEAIKNNKSRFLTTFEDETISYSFAHNMGNLKSIVVSNQVRVFDSLVSEKADIAVGVKNSLLYQLEKANLEDEYTIVNNYMVPIEYAMAVKAGDKELKTKLNNGLQQLRINGEYERIYEKWINEGKYAVRAITSKILSIVAIIIAIITAIFVINLRLNFFLKRQVFEKTKELHKINEDLENQITETRNNNELKNRIVENSPSAIIVFDRECRINLLNQSALRLAGINDSPIGQSVFEINLFKDILENKKDKVFLQDSKYFNEEITLKNKYGKNISYRYDIYHLFDFKNNIRGAILSIDDITKEFKLKEKMFEKEKNQAFNQIIAGMAHEIRNPLTSIKAFVELIPIKRDNVQFQNQLAEFVPKEVDRVNNLITSLIDYAKPKIKNMENVIVKDIINSCTILLMPMVQNKKIILDIDIEDDLVIKADIDQLKQVLINIIINGFESMGEKLKSDIAADKKLHMQIKAWKDEWRVFVQFTDEGVGMDKDEIKKATDPFFTTKASGTGLGLYITKQYVEENKGTMTIESVKAEYTKITLKFER